MGKLFHKQSILKRYKKILTKPTNAYHNLGETRGRFVKDGLEATVVMCISGAVGTLRVRADLRNMKG